MAKKQDSNVIILSIHPQYIDAIFHGQKLVEFRKNGTPADIEHIIFYSTSPDQLILGYSGINRCVVASPKTLWEQFNAIGGIEKPAYDHYFKGSKRGKCFVLDQPCKLLNPMSISSLGLKGPPQSFSYISRTIWQKVKRRKLVPQNQIRNN